MLQGPRRWLWLVPFGGMSALAGALIAGGFLYWTAGRWESYLPAVFGLLGVCFGGGITAWIEDRKMKQTQGWQRAERAEAKQQEEAEVARQVLQAARLLGKDLAGASSVLQTALAHGKFEMLAMLVGKVGAAEYESVLAKRLPAEAWAEIGAALLTISQLGDADLTPHKEKGPDVHGAALCRELLMQVEAAAAALRPYVS